MVYVEFGEKLTTIGSRAFYNCTQLGSIDKLGSVQKIGTEAFYGCTKLGYTIMIKDIVDIGASAFYNCTGINRIYMGKEISTIGANVFQGCNLTIYGHAGTRAESYAKEYSIPFVYTSISSIQVQNEPNKTKFIIGQDLNLEGGTIAIKYMDGTIEEVSMTDASVIVTGYDKTVLGEQNLTITYSGKTTSFKVNVTNDITKIQIVSAPTKTTYIKGEELDLTNVKVIATYEDGTKKEMLATDADVTITGYDKTVLGEQEVIITYSGVTTSFKVNVTNDVTKLQIHEKPSKLTYIKGETLDLTGGTLSVTSQDNTTEEIFMKNENVIITGYNKIKLGEQEITLEYKGKTVVFMIEVTNDITGIEIKETPIKTNYLKDEDLDLTGGKIYILYQDETKEEILMEDQVVVITGYDKTVLGEQELTVTYKEFATVFTIKVTTPVTEVKIQEDTIKTTYIKGEDLDLTSGTIHVTYVDGTTDEIALSDKQIEILGYDKTVLGEQNLTVKYRGESISFVVYVTNYVVEIEVKEKPSKITYVKGEELDLTGGKIIATYQDGSTEEKDITKEMVTGYDKTIVGKQNLTVTYEECTTGLTLKVTNDITGIQIKEMPIKITYVKGEELDLTGGKILVTYQDNSTEEIDITKEMVTGYDKTNVGEQVLTVMYKENTTSFKVIVTNELIGIQMKEIPIKTTYVKGEELDLTGGKILVIYQDNTTEEIEITKEMVIGYDKTNVGEQTVEVQYLSYKAEFEITVIDNENIEDDNKDDINDNNNQEQPPSSDEGDKEENKDNSGNLKPDSNPDLNPDSSQDSSTDKKEKVLKEITIKKNANKRKYTAGEEFSTKGMKIVAKYSDGTEKEITNYLYAPYGELKEDDDKITIIYTEGNIIKTIEYDITVKKNNNNNNITNDKNNNNNANNNDNSNNGNINNNNTQTDIEDAKQEDINSFIEKYGIYAVSVFVLVCCLGIYIMRRK